MPIDQDEQRAEARHDVERVVEELDVVGPLVLGELVQALDVAVERPVGEEAQEPGHDDRVVEPPLLDVGLADDRDAGVRPALEVPLHRGERDRLVPGDELRLLVAGRERDQHARDEPRDDARPGGSVARVVERAAPGARSRRRRRPRRTTPVTTRGRHVCAYCANAHGFNRKAPEVAELQRAVGADAVADRMLHEGVGADDEVARQPAADEQRERRARKCPRGPSRCSPKRSRPRKRRLEEEREHALHRERVPDDAAGVPREARPVGAELELHRDAGDDADRRS